MKRDPRFPEYRPPLPIGRKTKWGKISAIGIVSGERYYWTVDKYGGVAMMPADAVEGAHAAD